MVLLPFSDFCPVTFVTATHENKDQMVSLRQGKGLPCPCAVRPSPQGAPTITVGRKGLALHLSGEPPPSQGHKMANPSILPVSSLLG